MKIFDVVWSIKTAGPSPLDNERTELFLFGCNKAMIGNPCKGCFNKNLWDNSGCVKEHSPEEIVKQIVKYAPNKYITISGGEPLDQIEELIELCRLLKEHNFNIMIYTWHELVDIFNTDNLAFIKLLNYVDIIVDGEFKEELNDYDYKGTDGFKNSIGSSNQIIWKKVNKDFIGIKKSFIKYLRYDENENLKIGIKDNVSFYQKLDIRKGKITNEIIHM